MSFDIIRFKSNSSYKN